MNKITGIAYIILVLVPLTTSAKNVYVDANNGKDSNPGTLGQPFRTIQHASDEMVSGDVCYIRAGIYRETIVPSTDGLTFKNYDGEYVLITGLDIINGWKPYEHGIVQARSEAKITQVFVDGKRMNWARYPNEDGNMFNLDDLDLVNVASEQPTGKVSFENMEPRPADFWKGAYFVGLPTERNWWTAHRGRVVSSSGKDIYCAELSGLWERPRFQFTGEGAGYIIGCLNALDIAGEWHWQDNTLYLSPPETADPNTSLIEGRTRTHGFNLTDKKGITLEGLNFKAADIHMPDADNCSIIACTVRYGGTFSTFYVHSGSQREAWGDYENGASCIYVGGDNNLIKDCYAGKTWTHGISLWGNGNRLENSIIEHANWMGERFAVVWAPGDDNVIVRNTVRYSMRDGIELGNRGFGIKVAKRALVRYNHVHHCGYIVPDAGLIYANNQGQNPLANTEISYNVLHDFIVDHPGNVGIYLDNSSSGYKLHHNVIWNVVDGIRLRSAVELYFCNNTIVDVVNAINIKGSPGEDDKVFTKNNLFTSDVIYGTEISHNQVIQVGDFVDPEGRDYRLKPGVAAIDAGTYIDGITIDVVGVPDLGAYEYGKPKWTAGADLEVPDFPDETNMTIITSEK